MSQQITPALTDFTGDIEDLARGEIVTSTNGYNVDGGDLAVLLEKNNANPDLNDTVTAHVSTPGLQAIAAQTMLANNFGIPGAPIQAPASPRTAVLFGLEVTAHQLPAPVVPVYNGPAILNSDWNDISNSTDGSTVNDPATLFVDNTESRTAVFDFVTLDSKTIEIIMEGDGDADFTYLIEGSVDGNTYTELETGTLNPTRIINLDTAMRFIRVSSAAENDQGFTASLRIYEISRRTGTSVSTTAGGQSVDGDRDTFAEVPLQYDGTYVRTLPPFPFPQRALTVSATAPDNSTLVISTGTGNTDTEVYRGASPATVDVLENVEIAVLTPSIGVLNVDVSADYNHPTGARVVSTDFIAQNSSSTVEEQSALFFSGADTAFRIPIDGTFVWEFAEPDTFSLDVGRRFELETSDTEDFSVIIETQTINATFNDVRTATTTTPARFARLTWLESNALSNNILRNFSSHTARSGLTPSQTFTDNPVRREFIFQTRATRDFSIILSNVVLTGDPTLTYVVETSTDGVSYTEIDRGEGLLGTTRLTYTDIDLESVRVTFIGAGLDYTANFLIFDVWDHTLPNLISSQFTPSANMLNRNDFTDFAGATVSQPNTIRQTDYDFGTPTQREAECIISADTISGAPTYTYDMLVSTDNVNFTSATSGGIISGAAGIIVRVSGTFRYLRVQLAADSDEKFSANLHIQEVYTPGTLPVGSNVPVADTTRVRVGGSDVIDGPVTQLNPWTATITDGQRRLLPAQPFTIDPGKYLTLEVLSIRPNILVQAARVSVAFINRA